MPSRREGARSSANGTSRRMTVEIRNPKGQKLTTAERSNAVAESLRHLARTSRFADRKKGIQPYVGHRQNAGVVRLLFLACFVIPTVIGVSYFGFIASDRYITEAKIAVRPALGTIDKASTDDVGTSDGLAKQMIAQDTLILQNYMLSRPMVEAINQQMPLREIFSREGIDWFSSFNPTRPLEWLVNYWRYRVNAEIEPASGIIALSVNVFDPRESLAITKAILKESERMVNELSLKAREDSLKESRRELALAEERMNKVRFAVRDLRNRDGVLDAQKSNEANLQVIAGLRQSRIQLSVQLALQQRDLAPGTRAILDLKTQIRNLDENIAKIERESANSSPERRKVLADSLTQFEAFDKERQDAETYYGKVLSAHESARIIAARQIEFLTVVVEPVMADSPTQPRRVLMCSLVTAGSMLLFGLGLIFRRLAT